MSVLETRGLPRGFGDFAAVDGLSIAAEAGGGGEGPSR